MIEPIDFAAYVREIPDFPRPGVGFKDMTPLLRDPRAFKQAIHALADGADVDLVCGIESRGFILGPSVAHVLGVGFVPARKKGKLPGDVEARTYSLEYGMETLELHRDAVLAGERVLIVDDVLATGGTAAATSWLVETLGGTVAGFAFLIELAFLNGRKNLADSEVRSLIVYE